MSQHDRLTSEIYDSSLLTLKFSELGSNLGYCVRNSCITMGNRVASVSTILCPATESTISGSEPAIFLTWGASTGFTLLQAFDTAICVDFHSALCLCILAGMVVSVSLQFFCPAVTCLLNTCISKLLRSPVSFSLFFMWNIKHNCITASLSVTPSLTFKHINTITVCGFRLKHPPPPPPHKKKLSRVNGTSSEESCLLCSPLELFAVFTTRAVCCVHH